MIDPKELRIGNYINVELYDYTEDGITPNGVLRIFQIESVCEDGINIDTYRTGEPEVTNDRITGIELTSSILAKCGFEKMYATQQTEFSGYRKIGGGFRLWNNNGDLLYVVVSQVVNYRPIKYLHQLQNLFFCLTGEELTYTP